MRGNRSSVTGVRRRAGWVTAAAVSIGAVVAVLPSPVTAGVDPSEQRCFTVVGEPGDAAIVNLTPVLASGPGDGQLISSDVRNDPPTASNVNFQLGSVDPNVAVAPIGANGEVCFQNTFHARLDLVADHLGTIEQSAYRPATPSGAPDRKVDTRVGLGGGRIARSGQLCFPVVGEPGDAAIVNLTPVLASRSGDGQLISSDVKNDPPTASNVNFGRGSVDPNVAVAPIGDDGEVCFQNSRHSSVDLVADHLGTIDEASYYPATSSGAPDRKVDTRIGLGGTRLTPSGQLCFEAYGEPGDAAIVNLTPVLASGFGDGQLISSEVRDDPPTASNVNFRPGSVDPNVAVAPIGDDGRVCFQNSQHAGVDLVADHLGTILGSAYEPAQHTGAPDRRVDSRYDINDPRPECAGHTNTNYSTQTARMLFGLSSRAYEIEPGSSTGKSLDQYGSATVHFPELMKCWKLITAIKGAHGLHAAFSDTEVIIARNLQTHDLVVAFRGTEFDEPLDILTDLGSTRVPWTLPSGLQVNDAVHSGFKVAYIAVRDQVLEYLRAIATPEVPDARVYFTGHSLGGALASLASIDLVDDLQDLGYKKTEVVTYTFGAPRSMSKAMAGYHAQFAPVSFAVANPRDLVPHVPSAIGTDNPYSHLRQMVVLHDNLDDDNDDRVRVDQGDGRKYRGCARMPIGSVFDHFRNEYDRRLSATNYVGKPDVWITISNGENRLNWDSPLEGPCDWVGLFRTSGTLTSASNPIRDRFVASDGNDIHTTTVGKGANYWIGYVNMFGDLVSTKEYVPTTPSVSLRRNDNGIYPDTIDFNWSVSDAGDHDIVVLFDENPWTAGPNGYYGVFRTEAQADSNPPERTVIWVGSDPNKWWVAYIMVDDFGAQTILATSRGVRG